MTTEMPPLDPNRLTPEQAAQLLSAAQRKRVDIAQIETDLADGAPANPDGTINLVHYAAWLVKNVAHNVD